LVLNGGVDGAEDENDGYGSQIKPVLQTLQITKLKQIPIPSFNYNLLISQNPCLTFLENF
jgi:hypothetical protein